MDTYNRTPLDDELERTKDRLRQVERDYSELVRLVRETVRMGLRDQDGDEATTEYDIHKLQAALPDTNE